MSKKVIGRFHFTVDAKGVVALCRQAWLYEDRKEWAYKTIGSLAVGIPTDDIDAILHGLKTLKSCPDGTHCELVEEKDEVWLFKVQEQKAYEESKFYTFAGIKVDADLVNTYTNSVVARLRNAIRTPGLLALENPVELMRIEEQRQQMHREIFRAAGFGDSEIHGFYNHGGNDKIRAFGYELSKFVDSQTL